MKHTEAIHPLCDVIVLSSNDVYLVYRLYAGCRSLFSRFSGYVAYLGDVLPVGVEFATICGGNVVFSAGCCHNVGVKVAATCGGSAVCSAGEAVYSGQLQKRQPPNNLRPSLTQHGSSIVTRLPLELDQLSQHVPVHPPTHPP